MRRLINNHYNRPKKVDLDSADFANKNEWGEFLIKLGITDDPETVGTLNLYVTAVDEWDFEES